MDRQVINQSDHPKKTYHHPHFDQAFAKIQTYFYGHQVGYKCDSRQQVTKLHNNKTKTKANYKTKIYNHSLTSNHIGILKK